MTTVSPMTRRTGGAGVHGIYAEGRQNDGTVLRGFLAAEILGTSSLAPGAKGVQWAVAKHIDADRARSELELFFGGVEVTAVAVELTGQDIGRLRRDVMTSVIYPLRELLANTDDAGWEES